MPDMESVAWIAVIAVVVVAAFVYVASKSPMIQNKLQGK
jgi:hypothetical protein